MVYSYEIGTHAGCLPHRLEIGAGSLPPGLAIRRIDLDTHVVEGVATEMGVYGAWIHLLDCDNRSAETLFTFDVWARRWGIATESLPTAALGAPYSATLEGAGLPSDVTWELTTGALPAGLALSPAGTISGTPTAAGPFTFTVKATAKEKNFGPTRVDSRSFTLTVGAAFAARLSRTTAEVGVRVRSTLIGSGGQAPYTWSATGLPAGVTVRSDGTLVGVPRRAGSYVVNAQLTDANGVKSSVQLRLIVRPRLAIATKRLPSAAAGSAYRTRLAVRGGVGGLRWTISGGALPGGLRLATSSGTVAGVPARRGSFRITFRVRDALGAVSKKTLTLNVG
jgi:hypothetical protein